MRRAGLELWGIDWGVAGLDSTNLDVRIRWSSKEMEDHTEDNGNFQSDRKSRGYWSMSKRVQ